MVDIANAYGTGKLSNRDAIVVTNSLEVVIHATYRLLQRVADAEGTHNVKKYMYKFILYLTTYFLGMQAWKTTTSQVRSFANGTKKLNTNVGMIFAFFLLQKKTDDLDSCEGLVASWLEVAEDSDVQMYMEENGTPSEESAHEVQSEESEEDPSTGSSSEPLSSAAALQYTPTEVADAPLGVVEGTTLPTIFETTDTSFVAAPASTTHTVESAEVADAPLGVVEGTTQPPTVETTDTSFIAAPSSTTHTSAVAPSTEPAAAPAASSSAVRRSTRSNKGKHTGKGKHWY